MDDREDIICYLSDFTDFPSVLFDTYIEAGGEIDCVIDNFLGVWDSVEKFIKEYNI